MKILLSWLHEFLPITPSAQDVSQGLVSLGIEVGSFLDQSQGLDNVVVAKIVEFSKHPDADRLNVCKVTDGHELLDIVCGAKNFQVNDHVALAKIGAKLPNGLEIKKSKIRGVASHGMLCSEEELGFKEKAEGILILPSDSPLGKGLAEYLGKSDSTLELELTPNRGDCLSVIGVAQEVAAYFKVAAKIPSSNLKSDVFGNIPAVVLDPEAAPRYSLQRFDSVDAKAVAGKISARIEACGIRSLSSVVDITNYVMLERGQPLHAFDADKIAGGIEVRRAREGESILCLDDCERKLDIQDLVIADQQGPIAIAGIIGGKRTAVTTETKSVLLESAHFSPTCIRKTCKRLGLHTESSHRFERFVDPLGVWSASVRAGELLSEFCRARSIAALDLDKNSYKASKIRLRKGAILRYLGQDIKNAGEYLTRIGFSLEKIEDDYWVEVPTRRPDVTREIDLIEEIARLHGYSEFESHLPKHVQLVEIKDTFLPTRNFYEMMSGLGFSEARTYSFVSSVQNERFYSRSGRGRLRMVNGFTSDMQEMRVSLLSNLVDVWKLNHSRQIPGVRLFEIAKVYESGTGQETPIQEEMRLAVLIAGQDRQNWYAKEREFDFFDAKGVVEAISNKLDLKLTFSVPTSAPAFLHPGQCAEVLWRGKLMGYVGALHPTLLKSLDVPKAYVAELAIDPWIQDPSSWIKLKAISMFPHSQKDLAFVVKDEVPAVKIVQEVESLKLPILKSIQLFDVYKGKGMQKGSKSLAFALTFGSDEKTLTEQELSSALEAIVQKVTTSCDAQLRSG